MRTFSSDCDLVLWDLVDKFWPLRTGNMILRANATKIFEQTDDNGTRDVRNISVEVTLSSNGQRKSGIHIGMSMQRPRHLQLK